MTRRHSSKASRMFLFALLTGLMLPAVASAYSVRVSIKFILDSNGNRPMTGNLNTNSEVYWQMYRANTALCNSGSDMRLALTEAVDLGGVPFLSNWPCTGKDLLEQAAKSHPAAFAWRSNAINPTFRASGFVFRSIPDGVATPSSIFTHTRTAPQATADVPQRRGLVKRISARA